MAASTWSKIPLPTQQEARNRSFESLKRLEQYTFGSDIPRRTSVSNPSLKNNIVSIQLDLQVTISRFDQCYQGIHSV